LCINSWKTISVNSQLGAGFAALARNGVTSMTSGTLVEAGKQTVNVACIIVNRHLELGFAQSIQQRAAGWIQNVDPGQLCCVSQGIDKRQESHNGNSARRHCGPTIARPDFLLFRNTILGVLSLRVRATQANFS
jgi:hypothetical protein